MTDGRRFEIYRTVITHSPLDEDDVAVRLDFVEFAQSKIEAWAWISTQDDPEAHSVFDTVFERWVEKRHEPT